MRPLVEIDRKKMVERPDGSYEGDYWTTNLTGGFWETNLRLWGRAPGATHTRFVEKTIETRRPLLDANRRKIPDCMDYNSALKKAEGIETINSEIYSEVLKVIFVEQGKIRVTMREVWGAGAPQIRIESKRANRAQRPKGRIPREEQKKPATDLPYEPDRTVRVKTLAEAVQEMAQTGRVREGDLTDWAEVKGIRQRLHLGRKASILRMYSETVFQK